MASLHIFNVAGRLGYKLSVRISPDYSGLLICPELLGLNHPGYREDGINHH